MNKPRQLKKTPRSRPTNETGETQIKAPRLLEVFISSRIEPLIMYTGEQRHLKELRRDLAEAIFGVEVFGAQIAHVWTSEEASEGLGETAVQRSLRRAREADIVIALVNGEAGFAISDGDIGICHAELLTAYEDSPEKVRIVVLPQPAIEAIGPEAERNAWFQAFLTDNGLWLDPAANGDHALTEGKRAFVDALIRLTTAGARAGRSSGRISAQSLDWERMDQRARAERIRVTTEGFLRSSLLHGESTENDVHLRLDKVEVLCRVHAVPEALSFGPARDLVGQVFRDDHRVVPDDPTVCGPVHVIACHRGCTRNQARKLLGVDDATYVETRFGVFMADEIEKVQVFLVSQCRDADSTREQLAKCIEWIRSSGQPAVIGERARQRRIVVNALREVAVERPPAATPSAKPSGSPRIASRPRPKKSR